ncbi:MAG: terminase small subunit [Sphingomonadales bacterium]
MSSTELTPKQRRFVDEYLIDLNATQAALRAGYSERRARQQGSRLLKYPHVAAAVRQGQGALAQRAQVSAETVLEKLAELREGAAAKGQYSVALRAEELRGKHIGMFADRKSDQIRRLEEMTEEEIVASLGLDEEQIDQALSPKGDPKA